MPKKTVPSLAQDLFDARLEIEQSTIDKASEAKRKSDELQKKGEEALATANKYKQEAMKLEADAKKPCKI